MGGQVVDVEDEAVEIVYLVSGSRHRWEWARISVVGIRSGRRALARAGAHGMPGMDGMGTRHMAGVVVWAGGRERAFRP